MPAVRVGKYICVCVYYNRVGYFLIYSIGSMHLAGCGALLMSAVLAFAVKPSL